MTILFTGTSISDFDYAVVATAQTSSTYIDTNLVSEGINLMAAAGCWVQCTISDTSEIWVGFRITRINPGVNTQNCYYILLYATSGQLLFYWNQNNSGASSSMDSFGGDIFMADPGGTVTLSNNSYNLTAGKHKWDINIKIHNTEGFVRFYQNGGLVYDSGLMDTLRYAGTGSTINRVRFGHPSNDATMGVSISEIFISDTYDSRDVRVNELRVNGNGFHTAWTNDYTAVDETGFNDGDYILAASEDLSETFLTTDIYSGLPSYDVLGVTVSMRARRGALGPQNLQSLVRTNSSDFSSANIAGLEQAFIGGIQYIWETNPDTGLAWTQAEVNAAEWGVKSAL